MKDQWKGFALSLAVGLIMGGGIAAAVGERNLQKAEARLEKTAELEKIDRELGDVRLELQIVEVKEDEEKTFDAVMELAIAMARVEEKLDALAR